MLTTRYKMLLQKKSPALKKYMNVNNQFWTSLIDNEVLSSLEVEEFTVSKKVTDFFFSFFSFFLDEVIIDVIPGLPDKVHGVFPRFTLP